MAYSERFERALQWAVRLHRDQVRKGSGAPYVTHLLAVAAMVGESGGTEDEVIAALLHDAVEDQGGQPTLHAIDDEFGPAVARIVLACTDAETTPKPPWRARKEAFLNKLRHADTSVWRITLADKIHNTRTLLEELHRFGPTAWRHFRGGPEGTLWYLESIANLAPAEQFAHWVAEFRGQITRLRNLCFPLEQEPCG